ncbi:hypothetical protein D3C72_1147820 [compost metagenome]
MTTTDHEFAGGEATAHIACDTGNQHDQRERHIEGKDGHERCCGHGPQPAVLQRARADPVSRVDDNGRDCRLDAVEDPRHHRDLAKGDVDPGQANQDEQRGQYEQYAGNHPAPGAVHEPTDVGGQLLCLGAWQQHAVVQRVQEPLLADPAPALDQFLVHDRDLPGGPTKTDEAQLEPEQECFEQSDRPLNRLRWWLFAHCRGAINHFALPHSRKPSEGHRRCPRRPLSVDRHRQCFVSSPRGHVRYLVLPRAGCLPHPGSE